MKNMKIKNRFKMFCKDFSKFKLLEKTILLAPILVWFSYFPDFHLGKAEGANIEFSLPMIYIVILAIVGLPRIWQNRNKLISKNSVLITFAFVLWNFISILGSYNVLRSILTSGVWLFLWLDFLAILVSEKPLKLAKNIFKIFIFMSVIMSIMAIMQVVYGTWTNFGLCKGCISSGFGFTRPSVFAIEPQFFGSLLLAPILILLNLILLGESRRIYNISLFINLLAIYLTLSRGAIFALLIAIFALILINSRRKLKIFLRNFAISTLFVVFSFIVGMLIHGIFTQLNSNVSDGFYDSVAKSINQMSLGKISLPKNEENRKIEEPPLKDEQLTESRFDSVENPVENSESLISDSTDIALKNQPQKASFDGYVEKSTEERTKLSSLAIETWKSSITTLLFGVGAGGSGKAILETTGGIATSSEIVQNEFLSILLELGLVGLLLWAIIIVYYFLKNKNYRCGWAIMIAFLFQWNFFSGLPNALHIYLILAILFGIIERAYEEKFSINRWFYSKTPSRFFRWIKTRITGVKQL